MVKDCLGVLTDFAFCSGNMSLINESSQKGPQVIVFLLGYSAPWSSRL
jgi:hypothetical protein